MQQREYLVALYSFLPFGPARTKLLIKYFGSAEAAWKASKKELKEINLSEKIIGKFINFKKKFDPSYFNRLKDKGIKYVTYTDKKYPANLKEIDDLPLVLYYLGDLKKSDINAVSIVGSRKMSSYGKRIANDFSAELAVRGITIISGLALGIDAVAHKSALDVEGRTIAVIAGGLDKITPVTNFRLAKRIIEEGRGAVVSEFPLGHDPRRHDFAIRNRIISGLSKAVLVVEGQEKSGTLLTASHAAEQGREVFAVPGQITSPLSGAPHHLIKKGAQLTTSTEDILQELDLQLKVNLEEVEKLMPEDEIESAIMKIISKEEKHLDEIIREMGSNTSEVTSKLTMMEIKGLIKNMGDGKYSI